MTARRRRGAACLVLSFVPVLTACGGPPVAAPRMAAARPLAVRRLVALPTTPAPTQRLTLRLAPAGPTVRLAVTTDAQGTASLRAVVASSGRTVWRANHVAAFGVLEFGPAHAPVVITQSDGYGCGSGGCAYTGYTWVAGAGAGHMQAVAGGVGVLGPAYRFDRTTHRFAPEPDGTPPFFGFGRLDRRGLILASRLYDPLQHVQLQAYAYTPGPGPAGTWLAAGAASYAPDQAVPANFVQGAPQGAVPQAYLTAVCLGLPRQAASLAAAGTDAATLYAGTRKALVPCDVPAFAAVRAAPGRLAAGSVAYDLYALTGAPARLRVETVVVGLTGRVGRVGVAWVRARPVAVAYATLSQVLARAARAPVVRAFLRAHPRAMLVAPYPTGPFAWRFGLDGRGASRAFRLDARTGKVSSMPGG